MGIKSSSDDGMITDINMTPLVDIVLVLLIIFMVTARLIVAKENLSMPMDLPKAASGKDVQLQLGIELGKAGETLFNGDRLPSDTELVARAAAAKKENPEARVVIKADSSVPHGRVIQIMDMMNQTGLTKIAFAVTAAPAASPSAMAAPAVP